MKYIYLYNKIKMKIYLDLCDFSIGDNHLAIDIADDCIDWYDQNNIEIEMDRTVDNMRLLSHFLYKIGCEIIINHTEDYDLSFSLHIDKLDIRITEWSIFIYITK